MKMHEIMEDASAGAVSTDSVATVAQPIGEVQRRVPELPKTTKYTNRPADNYASPKRKQNAR